MARLAGSPSNGAGSERLTSSPRLIVPTRPGRRRRGRPRPGWNRHYRDLAPLHLSRLQHHDPPRRRRRRPRRCRGADEWQSRRIAALRKPVESLQVAAAVRRRRLPVRGQEDPQFRQEVLLDLRRLGVDPWLRFVLRLPRRRCVRILRQDLFAGRRIDPETDRPPEDDLAAADRPRIRQEATSRRQIARESVRRRPRGGRSPESLSGSDLAAADSPKSRQEATSRRQIARKAAMGYGASAHRLGKDVGVEKEPRDYHEKSLPGETSLSQPVTQSATPVTSRATLVAASRCGPAS